MNYRFTPEQRLLASPSVATTILFGAVAVLTHHHYAALITLGVFYRIVISKMMSQFLAPKIQSLVAGFLSGTTARQYRSATGAVERCHP